MSFSWADLKKTVRRGKEGYQVTPARLEGRPDAFRIEFLLQQFEEGLGQPRRTLDPGALLEFVGDARLGCGLLAALSQWYRMRPRTFAEVLDEKYPPETWRARFAEHGLEGPIDLRACLFAAANRGGKGYLDPEAERIFWPGQARALGLSRPDLQALLYLDGPEEAILVRSAPRPTPADVMAVYNARALTTLLRCASEVALRCAAPPPLLERAARAWADPLAVEWQVDGRTLLLPGRADALGSWTRHGRRVERVALALLAHPDVGVREVRGRVEAGDRSCSFAWKEDTLERLGAGRGPEFDPALPERIDLLAAALRRERDRRDDGSWTIRRPTHVAGASGGVCLPHLELRRGDRALFLLLTPSVADGERAVLPFREKTPVALAAFQPETGRLVLRFPGGEGEKYPLEEVLAALEARLDGTVSAEVRSAAKAAA